MLDLNLNDYEPLQTIALLLSDEKYMDRLESMTLGDAINFDWAGRRSENEGDFKKAALLRFISGIGYEFNGEYLEAGYKYGHVGKLARRVNEYGLTDEIKETFEIPCYQDAERHDIAAIELDFMARYAGNTRRIWTYLIPSKEQQDAVAARAPVEDGNNLDYIFDKVSGTNAVYLSYIERMLDTSEASLPGKGQYDDHSPEKLVDIAQDAIDQRRYDKAYELLKAAARIAGEDPDAPGYTQLLERIEHNRTFVKHADPQVRYWAGLEDLGVEPSEPQVTKLSSRFRELERVVPFQDIDTSKMSDKALDKWARRRATAIFDSGLDREILRYKQHFEPQPQSQRFKHVANF